METTIKRIIIKKEVDNDTDLSHLGSFSNEKGKYAIEHSLGDSRTLNYFNADNVEDMQQAQQNYKRIMQYENGSVCDYGITAYAKLSTDQDTVPVSFLINTISSGGLWGISSDSEQSYIKSVGKEQLIELKKVLLSLGFTKKEIDKVVVEVL